MPDTEDIIKARADGAAEERAAVIRFLMDRRGGNANERSAWDDLIHSIERGYHVTGTPVPF